MTNHQNYLKILLFFLFFLPFHLLSSAKSGDSLYFPIAFEIDSTQQLQLSDFTDGTISFSNKVSHQAFSFSFDKAVLEGKNSVIFLTPKSFLLPSGTYDTVTLSVFYNKAQRLKYEYKIDFSVESQKTTVMGGIFVVAQLPAKDVVFKNLKVISVNSTTLNFQDIVKSISGFKKENLNFNNKSSPIIQDDLPIFTGKNSAHFGTEIRMPCSYDGIVTLGLKHDKDPILYNTQISIKQNFCGTDEDFSFGALTFNLSQGSWTPVNITQIQNTDLKSLNYDLINKNPLVSYFLIEKTKFLKNNAKLKVFEKNFSINVDQKLFAKPFLYIGAFEPKLSNNGDIESISFKRDFVLRDFRKRFGERQVFNGYTGERVVQSKPLGTISVLFNNIHKENNLSTSLDSEQNIALTNISTCIAHSEQGNPLFEVNGSILMTQKKDDDILKQYQYKFTNPSESVQDFRQCLIASFTPKKNFVLKNEFLIDVEIYGL